MDAHRLQADIDGGLGGEQLGHSGLHVAALALVVGVGGLFDEETRGLDLGGHVGEFQLDRLMLADRFPETLAELAIAHRLIEGRLGNADPAGGDVDAAQFQAAQRMLQSPPLFAADQAVSRDVVVGEDQFGRVDALVAELFQLPAHREPRPLLGEKQAHAAMPRLGGGIGFDQQREDLAVDAVRNPGLGAVDEITLVALAPRGGADGLQIGAAIGLRQRQAATQLASREAWQELLFLRRRAEALDRGGHDQMRVENARQRHPHRRDGLHDLGVGGCRQAKPAILGPDGRAEQAERLHALDNVFRVDVVVFQRADVRLDLAVEEPADAVEDQLVLSGIFGRHR